MRMFTEVGNRVYQHCTGAGKALLSQRPDDGVRALLARTGMPAKTENTITVPDVLLAELAQVRTRGYAIDNGEQELGVQCIAVPVSDGKTRMAISVSGPAARMTDELVERAIPLLTAAAADLVARLALRSTA